MVYPVRRRSSDRGYFIYVIWNLYFVYRQIRSVFGMRFEDEKTFDQGKISSQFHNEYSAYLSALTNNNNFLKK